MKSLTVRASRHERLSGGEECRSHHIGGLAFEPPCDPERDVSGEIGVARQILAEIR